MKINIKTNYKGYFPVPRAMLKLIKNGLTFSELGAYIVFVSQVDYDDRHANHGVVIRDDKELAKELNCSSVTIFRKRKSLIKIGLLYEEDGLTKITNFLPFTLSFAKSLASLSPEMVQKIFTNKQEDLIKMLRDNTETQEYESGNEAESGY